MLLLILFSFIAGAGTAITPCVLPVLPALLAASAAGGRRRPVGIVLGLAVTYTVAIVALASVIDGVGLAGDVVRTFAIAALAIFGIAIALPAIAARIEAPLSRLARFGPASTGDGFRSGLGVGAALGFVYAPCAGPILAAVISVSATQGTTARLVALAVAYAAGSSLVLLLLALGGQRLGARIRSAGRGPSLQRALGGVMIATAVLMTFGLDTRFQSALAQHAPAALVNPTRALEESGAVKKRLAHLRGRSRFEAGGADLPVLGRAPDFTGTQRWFNTPGGRPLTLAGLRGRVVLVDFWTYTCVNCIRTLPYLRAWDARYRRAGLTIVGVHTPEFTFERDAGNVGRAIGQFRLRYPVAQDNAYATWNAWGNQYWPAEYLIDARGRVRHVHFGEGSYGETERAIRTLLAEAGRRPGSMAGDVAAVAPSNAQLTPETYVGSDRAERFLPRAPQDGTRTYVPPARLPLSHFALAGRWRVSGERGTALGGSRIEANVRARRVYLVMTSPGDNAAAVTVRFRGTIARHVAVRAQKLYELLDLPRVQEGRLSVALPRGVSAYAFTFG